MIKLVAIFIFIVREIIKSAKDVGVDKSSQSNNFIQGTQLNE
jgi:hypothetical protein